MERNWIGWSTAAFHEPVPFLKAPHKPPSQRPTRKHTTEGVGLLTQGDVCQKQDVVGGAPDAACDLSVTLTLHFVSDLGIKVPVNKLYTGQGKIDVTNTLAT